MSVVPAILVCLALISTSIPVFAETETKNPSECHFPEFVQSPVDKTGVTGDLRPWSTRTWWLNIRNSPHQAERQAVYVSRRVMWAYRQQSPRACDPFGFTNTAFTKDCPEPYLLYNRTCLVQESGNMVRVLQTGPNRKPLFVCLDFIRRGANVIQVRQGPIRETNDPDLCDDLQLDEWPWIAPYQKEHYRCPVTGGFLFRTISRLTNDDICRREWRWSHLDAECVIGDGMDFFAPKGSRCNPFSKLSHWSRLGCWAAWDVKGFTYVVSGGMRDKPKFCLRFPKVQRGEFTVLVYFSVICPSDHNGIPPHGIEYYELTVRKNDPSKCADEGRRCKDVASRGACRRDVNKYAKHCRKSCDLCQHGQMGRLKACVFPARFYGDWHLYTGGRTEMVNINGTHATISNLGKFSCAEPHPTDDLYKLRSIFTNGCSERYTCLQMKRYNQNLLQYKVGRSERVDRDMDKMCVFSDDPAPLFKSVRSFSFKNLLEKNRIIPTFCGLGGTIPFNTTINGQPCSGYISDWNESVCSEDTKLHVWSYDCPQMETSLDFDCLASIRDENGLMDTLLITRSTSSYLPQYNCWVLTVFKSTGTTWPYRILYRLNTTQCDYLTDIEVLVTIQPLDVFYLHDNRKSSACRGKGNRRVLPAWRPTLLPRPGNRRTNDGAYGVKSSRRPELPHIQRSSKQNSDEEPLPADAARLASHFNYVLLISILVAASAIL